MKLFPAGAPMNCLIAVMDGHGGDETAKYCEEEFVKTFLACYSQNHGLPAKSKMRQTFNRLHCQTQNFDAGTTLSAAWVREKQDEVVVGILGDSPVIVVDGSLKVHVSPEHNVRSNTRELAAVQSRGGNCDGRYVLNEYGAGIQLTRALGDMTFRGILSREPEVYTVKNPQWVIVATDGVFDPGHADTEMLAQEIAVNLRADSTAQDIMRWATGRVLKDNATVLLWNRDAR
ncbi:MAG: hypothetical protein A3J09_00685 [Candidatus Zambryskibacteria bacterium RIFCSPLOWO2_02_FULL_51_21]|uniref:PPM-type phosphatase domain-containing protein n=1 Tax=Candidatus Zambryskibacteria bacterium RIFCSPHIGHO2_02_FULL_43_37 TaxID=1802749 RepID=A0A1G2THF7_9BACT|nr:MAG: hypothetical protein A2723_00680 [Candidatus Zambryskibacteria bacterium RIFCSPHIGHO2_01_FULL_52_18]OHA96717.1 MAG: hypothetical protein A3D49_02645 [Candidatus Zambryskibacteria bacterium RIFCSPHIGHO2_02_FULL_43_37]OHB07410.1 MAG: hypothetical protein A2944_01720 [Candidatus Zambryskibacteria bacterium RIFCSPLOWO2_01_FULL_52_12]OHB11072.1 MAG: hypothetical protein A3J09_00685 [Candidatus Zambryskibacteria bacterium RIFCSPLOWO2_02_FULL_51_21]